MLNRIPPPFALSAGANSVSSGTLVFSNSNNVTFGLNGSTITGSASFAGGGFSAGVSTGGNTAGSTGVSGTRLVLVGSQNITLSQSTDANGATVSFSGGAGAAGNTGFLQAGANTASLGTVNFSNSNGISFGLNGQTMTGSHNALTSQSNQAASAANGSFAFQTLSFSNLNGISFGTSAGSAITASHNAITTARASTDAIGLNTAQTNVTWTVNSSGISLNAGGYAGTGFTSTTTAGTAVVGTNNTAGLSLGIPAYLTTADLSANSSNYVRNWKLTGNTAGTTSSAQGTDLWLAGGNGVTISGSSNTLSFSVATNYQSQGAYLTTARASNDAIGLNTAQTNVTWTVNSSGLSLNAGGYAGTGFTSTTTAGTVIVATNNTAGLSMGVPAFLTTADLSANSSKYMQNWKLTGNTAGTTSSAQGTDVWYSGGANITLSGNSNTIVVVGAAAGTGAFSAGASNLGNTAGSTGITGTQLVLVGSGAISLSQSTGANGGTLSINAPPISTVSATGWASMSTAGSTLFFGASTTMNLYASSNTFGTSSGTADMRSISIAGAGAVSVAASNSGWVISAPQEATISAYEIVGDMQAQALVSNSTLGQNSLYFCPFDLQAPLNAYRMNVFLSIATTVSAANSTGRGGYTISAALYSAGTGASTDRINTFWSGTAALAMTMNSNTQLVITNVIGISNSTQVSSVGTSLSSSNATTYPANSMGGFRALALPISSTLTPGRYWLAIANSTSSSNAGACLINASVMQLTMSNFLAFRPMGTSSAASNASFYPYMPGAGTYSLSSGGFPASVPLTSDSIRMSQTFVIPYVNFSGYTTGVNWL